MVDTIRSLAALQALMPDNLTEEIEAPDVRDFLVSVYPGYTPTSIGEYDDYFITDESADWTTVAPDTGSVTWNYNVRQIATRGLYARPVDITNPDLGAYLKPLTGITTTDYIQTSFEAGGEAGDGTFGIWLVFTNGTTSAASVCGSGIDWLTPSAGTPRFSSMEGTLTASARALDIDTTLVRSGTRQIHIRLIYNSTTSYGTQISLDGDTWQTWSNQTVAAFTPTHGGFAVNGDGQALADQNRPILRADYFHSNVTS